MGKISLILLLDDVSKTLIKTNISMLASKGVTFITNLSEITEDMLPSTHTIIILEGFMQISGGMSDLKLFGTLLGLDYIYLGQNEEWFQVLEQTAYCYKTDISVLNYDVIQAAYFKDRSLESAGEPKLDNGISLAEKIISDRSKHTDEAVRLADSMLSVHERSRYFEEKCAYLEKEISRLNDQNLFLHKDNMMLQDGYSEIVRSAIKVNQSLHQYEVIFTKNIYQKLDIHNYNDRPAIIYLKEQETLQGLDMLLETLYFTIKIQDKRSVKVLRLYDNSGCRRILTLPDNYKVISNRYLNSDIDANDFICKSGDYMKIMEMLLLNRLHLDVLIIADCKDHNDTVLSGSILCYNLCGRASSMKSLGLQKENTIVNDHVEGVSELEWNDFATEGYRQDETFMYLSAKPVIQNILAMLRQNDRMI